MEKKMDDNLKELKDNLKELKKELHRAAMLLQVVNQYMKKIHKTKESNPVRVDAELVLTKGGELRVIVHENGEYSDWATHYPIEKVIEGIGEELDFQEFVEIMDRDLKMGKRRKNTGRGYQPSPAPDKGEGFVSMEPGESPSRGAVQNCGKRKQYAAFALSWHQGKDVQQFLDNNGGKILHFAVGPDNTIHMIVEGPDED